MENLERDVDRIATETGFSGVVRVDRDGSIVLNRACGMADRAHGVANTVDTQFGIASGTKSLTALTVVSLVEAGVLDLSTTARSVLDGDLPLIAGDVTVEHLLAHRSGIGDYYDEDTVGPVTDYVLAVPANQLGGTEDYLKVLDGYPTKFRAGERFSYCNGGYVVLALIAERAAGTPFHELVEERVCRPAGMPDTAFLRSDELPARAAVGYVDDEGLRTNVFHLPVRGSGDGGIYSTVPDIHALWHAVFEGRVVSEESLDGMVLPRSEGPTMRYGLGFWLHASGDAVILEGSDAGVSFRSVHEPSSGVIHTVVSNTSDGAWPLARHLRDTLVG